MRVQQSILSAVCGSLLLWSVAAPAFADGVLVFGGTGQLGARIVRLLVEAGEEVTVFARPTSDRSRLEGWDVSYAVGDMLDEESVAAAFEATQYRVVIYAARAPISEIPFYDITSGYIAAHAKATGVKQIIHHGAVGAGENMAQFPALPWDAVPGLRRRMEDHGVAERNYFASGVNTTILRNSRVWPDETPGTGKAELSEDQSTMTPTTRADLAMLTMRCLDNPDCSNRIYHVKDETLSWPPPGREE